jgi:hypothetical protein
VLVLCYREESGSSERLNNPPKVVWLIRDGTKDSLVVCPVLPPCSVPPTCIGR